MTIDLTDRERDLLHRVLTHVINECNHALGPGSVPNKLEKLSFTWLRDEIEALKPKFQPPVEE